MSIFYRRAIYKFPPFAIIHSQKGAPMSDAIPPAKKITMKTVVLYACGLVAGAVAAQLCFMFFLKADVAPRREAVAAVPAAVQPQVVPQQLPTPPVSGVVPTAAVPEVLPANPMNPANPESGLPLAHIPEQPESVSSAPPALALSGIFLADDSAYAIINDQVVKAGDKVKNCTVKMIGTSEVAVECQGEKVTLSTRSLR